MKGSTAHGRDKVATARKAPRRADNAKGDVKPSASVQASTKDASRRADTKARQEGKPRNGAANAGAKYQPRPTRSASTAKVAVPKRAKRHFAWITQRRAIVVLAFGYLFAGLYIVNPDMAIGSLVGAGAWAAGCKCCGGRE